MYKHQTSLKNQSIFNKVGTQRKKSASSSSISNKFNDNSSIQEIEKARKIHNRSIDNRSLEKSIMKNARYKEEVKNTYKMPPLINEHKVTPSQTIMTFNNSVDSDFRTRHAITPFASPGKQISPREDSQLKFLNNKAILANSKLKNGSHNVKYESILGFSEFERPKTKKFN